jgi:glycosyltransferase involved in cell wall biosynthesis
MIGTRGVPATFGGVERAVEELAARLAAAGHDVTVYCRTGYSPSRAPEHRGIRLRYLPAVSTKHLEAISHSLLATLDAVLRRYDVVHFHALGPGLCAPLARLAGLRVVTTVHALDFQREKWGRVARTALRLGAWCAARFPHRTVVVSQELERYFASAYGRRTTYIPNGVVLAPRADLDEDEILERRAKGHVLFLGRLVPEKGVHTLIEAYRELETDLPLVIAGPASHSEEYEKRLRALARDDARISFAGAVYGEEKAELLARTYVFCQPSTVEGLPIVLLEIMAEGICPLVSDIPEHLEVVTAENGAVAALTFRAGDVAGLRDALAEALASPALLAERGRLAREIVAERYDWDDAAARLQEVLAEVASRPRDRPIHPAAK